MSALKNLIRLLFCTAIAYALPAQAQILGMGINFEKLNLPEPFLQNLEKCSPYKFSQTSTSDEIEVKTIYSVAPTEDKLCHLYIEGHTNVSVHILQDCLLTPKQAETYATALRRYQAKKYSPRWDGRKIEKDPDYLEAFNIMSNRKICRFVRQEIDHTQDIRKNLPSCTPASQDETAASIKVRRQILKTQGDRCLYTFQMTHLPNSTTENIQKDIIFNCALNSAQREQYIQILEALVIPEEEGYDFSSVQRISLAEELNFIFDNCTFDTTDTENNH